jgi:hypothetical protein
MLYVVSEIQNQQQLEKTHEHVMRHWQYILLGSRKEYDEVSAFVITQAAACTHVLPDDFQLVLEPHLADYPRC